MVMAQLSHIVVALSFALEFLHLENTVGRYNDDPLVLVPLALLTAHRGDAY